MSKFVAIPLLNGETFYVNSDYITMISTGENEKGVIYCNPIPFRSINVGLDFEAPINTLLDFKDLVNLLEIRSVE